MIKNGITKRFAEVGKIKIGGKGDVRKSKEGKDYQLPVRYEHFVVTTTEKGKDGNFIIDNALMQKLGPEPREIPIRLPFDEIDLNFFTSFQYYHGNKCVCHGDGEKADRTGQDGVEKKIPCNPDTCEFLQAEKCKVSGILSCHIPVSMEVGGIYRFRTHSWNTVSSILAALEYFAENTNGVLQGLPLKLKFLKKATAEHGNVNICTIVLDGVELMKMRELAFMEYENRMKLGIDMKQIENQAKAAGFLADTDDPEDVQAEYYPVVDAAQAAPVGTTAEAVTEKLKTPAPPPVEPEGKQGNLL
jgi:hypothetical protein